MILNLTLLLQILHFGLAYWLLARFFFKPVLQYIAQQNQRERYLQNLENVARVHLQHAQQENMLAWQGMRKQMVEQGEFRQWIGQSRVVIQVNRPSAEGLAINFDPKERDHLVTMLVGQVIAAK